MAGKNIMANNWFKFDKYIDVSFSLQRNETRATYNSVGRNKQT